MRPCWLKTAAQDPYGLLWAREMGANVFLLSGSRVSRFRRLSCFHSGWLPQRRFLALLEAGMTPKTGFAGRSRRL